MWGMPLFCGCAQRALSPSTRRIPILVMLCLGIVSCGGAEKQTTEPVEHREISEFDRQLFEGYRRVAKHENYENHFGEEAVFMGRARQAAAGELVEPEHLVERRLPEETVGELTAARARLQRALDEGMAIRRPRATARAQVMFDCWMEEQEEDLQPEDIKRCREGFMQAMAELGPIAAAPVSPPEPACTRDPGCVPASPFIVYFGLDKDKLDADSQRTIRTVAEACTQHQPDRVLVSGHADRAGQAGYNDALSQRRTRAVVQALQRAGIPSGLIVESHFGERRGRVSTPDGERNPENRRVEIQFHWQ